MKKLTLQRTLFLIILCLFFISCKKDSTQDNTGSFEVEYMISPISIYTTKITYTDQTGASIEMTDLDQFPNGSRKITVSKKPFTAKLSVQINNTTNATINFDLYILVDSQFKKSAHGIAPAMSPFSVTEVEYTVQ
jgi:hypothetical protein